MAQRLAVHGFALAMLFALPSLAQEPSLTASRLPVSIAGVRQEGPHVFRDGQQYQVMQIMPGKHGFELTRGVIPIESTAVIQVPVDHPAQTVFEVRLRPTPKPAVADVPKQPKRLLMLSDFEGEFDQFVALLKAQKVIDAKLHWQYGDAQLVLVGDMVDRGELTTPLLWLIYRLEAEAEAAGGRVHYVLGNHEQMMMSGRTKYWSARQVAFAASLGEQGHRQLYGPQSVLGAWLASKPVMLRIGNYLFVHGGVSAAFVGAKLSVNAANEQARPALFTDLAVMPAEAAVVLGEQGVTWYRGMALRDDPNFVREDDPAAHLQAVLAGFEVKRVAIGHSIVPDIVLEQQGQLLRLDIHHASQVPQAALDDGGQLWRVDAAGGKVRLDADPTAVR